MVKLALTIVLGALMVSVGANAQNDNGLVAPELSVPTPGQLLDKDYLTVTGATVDRPGVPQASGPTELDRSIRQQDNRIDNSICVGVDEPLHDLSQDWAGAFKPHHRTTALGARTGLEQRSAHPHFFS